MTKLQNIYNLGRKIFVFERIDRNQVITEVNSFYPYYYEPDLAGNYKTYDGQYAKKIVVNNPGDIGKSRSNQSYESDVVYPKRYIVDNIVDISKSETKYLFFDIEILTPELPDVQKAKYPISCISLYNNYTDDYVTWYLGEWGSEEELLEDFVAYIRAEAPDIISAWNISFDYTYLYHRYQKLFGKEVNFGEAISPICHYRHGRNKTNLPAGISIVDYLGLFEKMTLGKKRSYALDYIAQEDLGEAPWGDTSFNELSQHVKDKNVNDVRRMCKIEQKYRVIPHFDEIRRFSKCLWEDLPNEHVERDGKMQVISNNSKLIDMIVLQEARTLGIVLPMKQNDAEKEDFEGAYRQTYESGVFDNIGKYDLSGAYMYIIANLCLDTSNIVDESTYNADVGILPIQVTDRKTNNLLKTYYVRQNPTALLPKVIAMLVNEKNKFKDLVKASPDDEGLEQKYKALKSIVLSSWGVIANQYFRLYDHRVASMITSSVRDLMHYVKAETEKLGFPVIYVDTDSVFCKDKGVNIADKLNDLVQKWSMERFNKPSSITFEHEGHFTKILILTRCHYYGYIKGVEVKKSSSSKFEAKFQEQLINKVLDREPKDAIMSWIHTEQERLKTLNPFEVSFPAKITNDEYKSLPIFVRAVQNSSELFPKFKIELGNLFYYAYVKPTSSNVEGKPRNVLAFTQDFNIFEKNRIDIDWDEMTRRNILNKVDGVFEVLGWGSGQDALNGQTTLF